jgi:transposase
MEVVHPRCSGLDVHKKSVVACVMVPGRKEVRTFGTVTAELLRLGDWLQEEGVTHVAMESTGVYWKPVFNVLENTGLELLVVNAQHIKAVPGRKTDVKDAEWIADLLRHGLVRASFIPSRPQRELRELVRYRKTVVEQRSRLVQRIQSRSCSRFRYRRRLRDRHAGPLSPSPTALTTSTKWTVSESRTVLSAAFKLWAIASPSSYRHESAIFGLRRDRHRRRGGGRIEWSPSTFRMESAGPAGRVLCGEAARR